ncbi:MAG: BMP family ABC transporter substrate-binding protein [Actinomycetota bacterium]|nr:BMP family ABC transporter substrate-binding protein [Actinomycetota bacterium]
MRRPRRMFGLLALLIVLAMLAAACSSSSDDTTTTTSGGEATTTTAAGGDETTTTAAVSGDGFTFGMILVGPENDHGWSQAHFEAGKYVEEKTGAKMISLDTVNPSDRPETSVEQVVDDMVEQGAQLIFATSDDMRDGIEAAAAAHPDIPMIWSSGDSAWAEGEAYRADLPNLGNIMGRMYYGKMMAGCAAALTSETGKIAYLGPLINDETRRLASSVYLGAQHCWEGAGNDLADLSMEVNWIGFWFNIPGVTLDPTEVTNAFFDGGADVVVSGIDTTEALVVAGQRSAADESVWAIPYDFIGACSEAPEVCLGVPYFNWGPSYLEVAEAAIAGTVGGTFEWIGPDWADINNLDTSMIGWVAGDALAGDASATLDTFIAGLGDGSINPFVGPLNYQDGTPFLADGEVGSDLQLWYMKQLLEGMKGASSA